MRVENEGIVLDDRRIPLLFAAGLVFARLVSLLGMSLDALRGYGDFPTFFQISGLSGWPFIQYWVEFPPVFPFLNAALHRMANGQEHVFDFLLFFVLLAADAGSLYLLARLARRLYQPGQAWLRAVMYLLALTTLAYTWWYFDALAVFFMLLGLFLLLEGRPLRAGAALAAGIATKLFPGLALVALWRRAPWKRLVITAALSLLPLILGYAVLWRLSPNFTGASLRSQASKGSWETVWALLDGNLHTGNFGALEDRLHPASAQQPMGHAPVVPPAASLILFVGVGLAGLLAARPTTDRQSLALVGFAMCLFFLWSPGWSPQWCLYLLPLILLVLPGQRAALLSSVFVLVNLLEWPVLLSRGYFNLLWAPVLLRTLLLVLMAGIFWSAARSQAVAETEPHWQSVK